MSGQFDAGLALWGRWHGVVHGTVGKNQSDICDDIIHTCVLVVGQLGPDGGEVHWMTNDVGIARILQVTTAKR